MKSWTQKRKFVFVFTENPEQECLIKNKGEGLMKLNMHSNIFLAISKNIYNRILVSYQLRTLFLDIEELLKIWELSLKVIVYTRE